MRTNVETELRDEEIAKRIASLLDEQALSVDAKVAAKLSYSRQQALAKMGRSPSKISFSQNGVLHLLGGYWHQHRLLMTMLMCGLGIIALFTMQNLTGQESAEQGDAYLLASDLPPEAYLNEGFGTWLSENTQQ